MPLSGAPSNVNLTCGMMGSPHPGIANCGLMFDTVQTKYALNDRLFPPTLRRTTMNMSMNIAVEPLLALVIGILILLVPRFLNYFVAVYLIVVGILGLMHHPLT